MLILDDNSRLYEELVRSDMGAERAIRLRLLAHEGLLSPHSTERPNVATCDASSQRGANVGLIDARLASDAFELPQATSG